MKHSLVWMMTALTLMASNALAYNNPHILEVDLSIEGVEDQDEVSPGGFVAKDGLKRIFLNYTGVNLPTKTRLNWDSAKIKVDGLPDGTDEIYWDPASTMPTQLWVRGLAASATGPEGTNGGPEHLCLEAINNGTPYVAPLYDRIAFTVIDLKIRTKRQNATGWDSDDTITEIAAGGLTTAVHFADIEIEVAPASIVSSSFPLTVGLTPDSGGGYLPMNSQQWWWPVDVHKRALLSIGSSTYEFGLSAFPITKTSLSLSGSIVGTLRSSNKVEPTTIRAECAGVPVEKVVKFGPGNFVFEAPPAVTPYAWTAVTVTRTFAGQPLEGHRLKIFAKEVEETDGTVVKAVYGNSLSTSYVLESFVWIGSHPSEDYYTGEGVFDEVTMGSSGSSASQYNVRGFHRRVEMEAIDLNTAEFYSAVPDEFAEYIDECAEYISNTP